MENVTGYDPVFCHISRAGIPLLAKSLGVSVPRTAR